MTVDRPARVGPLFLFVLASISAMVPLSLHIFFPALPAVGRTFGESAATVNLTLSVPLYVMAFATLAYGALSDRYGRRPVLLGATVLFVAGSALAAIADSVWTLIAARALQAAGGGGGLALARAIARDVYGADRLVRAIALLTMAYAITPMIATPLGGALVDFAGWRGILVTCAALGTVLLVASWIAISETHRDRGASRARSGPLGDFRRLFADVRFAAYVLQSGFGTGVFFVLAVGSSFVMIDYLGRPASEFGLYFMAFPFGFVTGSFLSSRLGGRVAVPTMVLAGSLLMAAAAAVIAGFLFAGIVTPLTIFLPGFFAIVAQGIALPNTQTGAILAAGPLAGTAAGIGVFTQQFTGGIFTQIYGVLGDGTPMPMAILLVATGLAVLVCGVVPWRLARRSA